MTLNVNINGENKTNLHPGVTCGWNGYPKKRRKSNFEKTFISHQRPNVNKLLSNVGNEFKKCLSSQLCYDSECVFQQEQCHVQELNRSSATTGSNRRIGAKKKLRTQIRIFGSLLCLLERLRLRKLMVMVSIITVGSKVGWYVTTKMLINLTVSIKLLRENIESNPGPQLEVLTFNCNGLGNQLKLKRLIQKIQPMIEKGAIVFLQETHIVNTEYLSLIYRHKFVSNFKKTNSAGVITLFNKDYEIQQKNEECEGRNAIVIIRNDTSKLILMNSYFPNDHKEAQQLAERVYTKLLETQSNHPDHQTIWAGDFNVCLTPIDCLNRQRTTSERRLAETLLENNKILKIEDSYRKVNSREGYTWKRGECYSRLDYIFVSKDLSTRIKKAKTEWAFENSDHAAVKITFVQESASRRGPGITKVNTRILEDPKVAADVEKEIEEMMKQTDNTWNPYAKLEILKVAIRSTIANKVMKVRRGLKEDIQDLEEEIDDLEKMRIRWIDENRRQTNTIDKATSSLGNKLMNLRNKLSNTPTFISRAKWFEFGEKSNQFFLNLNKSRQKQKYINKIKSEGKVHEGQEQVMGGIKSFYDKLYAKTEKNNTQEEDNDDEDFYSECPRLTVKQREDMDKEIDLAELRRALATCKDSAPGSDGITYEVYKRYWNLIGPYILDAWKYSMEVGVLPNSHLESIITLLPKENKDPTDIKNWRPITLSNCDAKIITKALAMRMAKVLESIIDKSQTAYVPGRSVSNNLRSNFYKNFCRKKNEDAVLISLDAKKAFDSVDHKYIERTLKAYGFGAYFILTFKTLYNNLKARILVNGFMSETLKIETGVKQGDALSCAIFIICIDPLIRNLNKSDTLMTSVSYEKRIRYRSNKSLRNMRD